MKSFSRQFNLGMDAAGLLSDIRGQAYKADYTTTGSVITSGITEGAGGYFILNTTVPDDTKYVKLYDVNDPDGTFDQVEMDDTVADLSEAHGAGPWGADANAVNDGDTAVDHNTGGTDALRVTTGNGVPVDNAVVRWYSLAEWDAGKSNAQVRGKWITDIDGRAVEPAYVNTNIRYAVIAEKPGVLEPQTLYVAIGDEAVSSLGLTTEDGLDPDTIAWVVSSDPGLDVALCYYVFRATLNCDVEGTSDQFYIEAGRGTCKTLTSQVPDWPPDGDDGGNDWIRTLNDPCVFVKLVRAGTECSLPGADCPPFNATQAALSDMAGGPPTLPGGPDGEVCCRRYCLVRYGAFFECVNNAFTPPAFVPGEQYCLTDKELVKFLADSDLRIGEWTKTYQSPPGPDAYCEYGVLMIRGFCEEPIQVTICPVPEGELEYPPLPTVDDAAVGCCGLKCTGCVTGGGDPPKYFEVTFNGVEGTTACLEGSFSAKAISDPAAGVNGKLFMLKRVDDGKTCRWEADLDLDVIVNCSVPADAVRLLSRGRARVTLTTEGVLTASHLTNIANLPGDPQYEPEEIFIFQGITDVFDCFEHGKSIANGLTEFETGLFAVVGKNGSAFIRALPNSA